MRLSGTFPHSWVYVHYSVSKELFFNKKFRTTFFLGVFEKVKAPTSF